MSAADDALMASGGWVGPIAQDGGFSLEWPCPTVDPPPAKGTPERTEWALERALPSRGTTRSHPPVSTIRPGHQIMVNGSVWTVRDEVGGFVRMTLGDVVAAVPGDWDDFSAPAEHVDPDALALAIDVAFAESAAFWEANDEVPLWPTPPEIRATRGGISFIHRQDKTPAPPPTAVSGPGGTAGAVPFRAEARYGGIDWERQHDAEDGTTRWRAGRMACHMPPGTLVGEVPERSDEW